MLIEHRSGKTLVENIFVALDALSHQPPWQYNST